MKKILVLFALALTSTALALEDTPENRRKEAERYMAATPPRELFADMAEQIAKTAPPEQREKIVTMLTKHIDIDAVGKAIMNSMVKNFTADELKGLADFYGSPVGKSAMKKFGTYMADIMPAMQAEMKRAMEKAQDEEASSTAQPEPAPTAAPRH